MIRGAAYMIGALVLSALVHAYLHRRLVRDTAISPRWRWAMFALGALFPTGMLGLLLMRDLPRSFQSPIMWCAFVWVGLLLWLLPSLFIGELVPKNPARRRAIARIVAGASGVATIGFGGASTAIAQLDPIVRRFRVPILKRPYRIVQLSDLHVSATLGGSIVVELAKRIAAVEPDLVAITGDLVDGSVREFGPFLRPLADLKPKDGVWFVTGNHEYLSGALDWLAFLPSLGVRILRNEHVAMTDFDLVGVDDQAGSSWLDDHGTDLEKALRGRDATKPAILLAHRPDGILDAVKHGIALQLSGHTHGGQIAPIGWALERLRQPYVYGMHEIEKTVLYVTSGAGYWGPPMRFATRAEIAVFELES